MFQKKNYEKKKTKTKTKTKCCQAKLPYVSQYKAGCATYTQHSADGDSNSQVTRNACERNLNCRWVCNDDSSLQTTSMAPNQYSTETTEFNHISNTQGDTEPQTTEEQVLYF